jgi:tetratricopeptide (TPR) repeat protein
MTPALLALSFAALLSIPRVADTHAVDEHAIHSARQTLAQSTTAPQIVAATESLASLLSQRAIEMEDASAAEEARFLYDSLLAERSLMVNVAAPEALRPQIINSYGVFMLERGDVESAMRIFGKLNEREVLESPRRLPNHARYFFNAGEAALRHGSSGAAFHFYVVSLLADPTFTDSCDRASELARNQPEVTSPEDVATLIRRGNLTCSDQLLRIAVTTEPWRASSAGFDIAIRLIAQLWTADAPSPAQVEDWKNLLATNQYCYGCQKKFVQLADLLKKTPFPIVNDDDGLEIAASEWRRSIEDRVAFSMLAISAGHPFAFAGEQREALARYALAWRVNPTNFDAATYAAGVLTSAGEAIDQTKRLIPDLGNAHAISRIEVTTPEQRRQLMRLNITLGDLRAKRNGGLDAEDGPIHWWKKAVNDYELLTDAERAKGEGAELYARLANASDLVRQLVPARNYNLACAKAYLETENWPEAETALQKGLKDDEPIDSNTMLDIERVRLAILLGDLGLRQTKSNEHPRVITQELRDELRSNSRSMREAASRPRPEARRSAAKRDLLIAGEVERRLHELRRGAGSTVVLSVQGVVYLFGAIETEAFSQTVQVAGNVRGVRTVLTRGAFTKPRNVKEWMTLQRRSRKRAVSGAVLGAVIGAASAILRDGDIPKGALTGALIGAVTGFVTAERQNTIFAPREQAARAVNYNTSLGYVARVVVLQVVPPHPAPGEPAKLYIRYVIVGPNPAESITVKVFRGLTYGADYVLGTGPHEFVVPRGGGIVESLMEITLPANAPEGIYGIEAYVEDSNGRLVPAMGTVLVPFVR